MVEIRVSGDVPLTDHAVNVRSSDNAGTWRVPEETPVAFVYNRRNYAVMLATPADIGDFAVGFTLTERVVDRLDDISSIDIHQSNRGVELRIQISPAMLERLDIRQQRRNLVGRAGCGVCGLENAEVFFEKLPRVADQKHSIKPAALQSALQDLKNHQSLNDRTRTVHAAAFASLAGNIIFVREDVGRHNALDKLLGAMALNSIDASDGFVLMSSRCSYEVIEKSARLGVNAVASISGPTAFAIRKAEEANIRLYCRSENTFVEINEFSAD